MMQLTEVTSGKPELCRTILEALPEWFGLADARAAYVGAAAALPMIACHAGQIPVGFVCIKPHTACSAELVVMGVLRQFHRQGIGRALVEAAAEFAKTNGLRFLSVKTLAASHPDGHYAATRNFYHAVGFAPIEVFPDLWGTANPCLLMIKPLAGRQQ